MDVSFFYLNSDRISPRKDAKNAKKFLIMVQFNNGLNQKKAAMVWKLNTNTTMAAQSKIELEH